MTSPIAATGSRTKDPTAPRRRETPPDARSAETDPGIQVAIEHVDRDVHADEEDRDPEDRPLHQRVVALDDRREEHPADPRHREDLLHDHGAPEELPDLDPEERDHDD